MTTVTHMTQEHMDDLAEQGAHAACACIQEQLGQSDGGFAALYFEQDGRWEVLTSILKDYIRAEINFAGKASG